MTTPYVAGDSSRSPTTSAACIVTAGELIGCTYEGYPNVQRWLGNMKKLASWPKVNEVMYGFAGSMKDKKFETVDDQGPSPQRVSLPRLRGDAEVLRGLPRPAARERFEITETKSGREDPRPALVLSRWTTARASRSSRRRTCRSSSRSSTTSICTSRSRSSATCSSRCSRRRKAAGIEMRAHRDHQLDPLDLLPRSERLRDRA